MGRTKIHLTAPRNWINDPNGFIYYKGEYHLFYQYFPYDCRWGTMHWWHATSGDLIKWKHHPIALYPTKEYDQNRCFSGTALIKDDKLHLYYTGVKYDKHKVGNIHSPYDNESFESSQVKIFSEDGYTFNNLEDKKIIIEPIMDEKLGHRTHTRDPKVWKYKDRYTLILGSKFIESGSDKFTGEVLFYTSEDGENWSYKNRYYDKKIGDMWECPDLFEVDNEYILIMSPEHLISDGNNYTNNTVYSIVGFDEESCDMKIDDEVMILDEGLDLYAAQTNIDKYGNRILIGWMRMPSKPSNEEWIGMMTLPRKITVRKNQVYFSIPDYINDKFNKKIDIGKFDINNPCKINVTLKENSVLDIGGYKIFIEDHRVVVDRSEVFVETNKVGKMFKSSILKGKYELKIYIDNGIIEVFINDGKYVISNIVYDLKSYVKVNGIEKIEINEMIF